MPYNRVTIFISSILWSIPKCLFWLLNIWRLEIHMYVGAAKYCDYYYFILNKIYLVAKN